MVISTLEQVGAKLQRARLHMTALEAEIAQWEMKNERSVVVKPTYIAQEDSYVFRISRVPDQSPLVLWGTSIGDFLYNVRSGLDYLAWHAAVKTQGGFPSRPTQVKFPITLNRTSYRKASAQFSQDFTSFFERYQPFLPWPIATERDREDHPLLVIQRLSNADKHRLLTPVLWRQGVVYMPLGVPSAAAAATATDAPVEVGQIVFQVRRRVLTYPKPPRETRLTPFVVMEDRERVPGLLNRLIQAATLIYEEACNSDLFRGLD